MEIILVAIGATAIEASYCGWIRRDLYYHDGKTHSRKLNEKDIKNYNLIWPVMSMPCGLAFY